MTDAVSHTPIEGVEACAFNSSNQDYEGCESTGAAGDYMIEGLSAGSYKIEFSANQSLNYISQYYSGKYSFGAADAVAVTSGAITSSIDAEMQTGGQIKGTVTDAATKGALEEIEVCVSPVGKNEFFQCATTDGSGQYAISALQTGTYKVKFSPTYNDQAHVAQYYDGKSSAETADSVSVTAGGITAGINAELSEGGRISGSVTKAGGGVPSESISVCAIPTPYENGGYHCAFTNGSGGYTITGLNAGNYKVQFSGSTNYLTQYYSGKESEAEATPVSVSLGSTTAGIDATLNAAGLITGRVTDAVSKSPLSSIEACAIKVGSSPSLAKCGFFQGNGEYTIGGLPSGEYKVRFEAGYGEVSPGHYAQLNYLTQFYKGKALESEADPVTVTAGSTSSHIDAEMHEGGRLSGKVTSAVSHAAIEGVYVCAQSLTRRTESGHCASTDSEGNYAFSGLSTGAYSVRFNPGYNDRADLKQFYDAKASLKEAEHVQVTAGTTTSGIDAQMKEGAKITGKVIDFVTKAPIEDIEVCPLFHGSCATTDAAGEYTIEGLKTGQYTVTFNPGYQAEDRNYISQYYNDKGSTESADPVSATAGSTTANIDAEMHEGGRITGKITDAVTKLAIGAQACASNNEFSRCASTDKSGEYVIEGLPSGSYKVRFYPEPEYGSPESINRNYLSQYYNGKVSGSTADPVSVSAGATTSGIDAELREGAKVTGRVIDASSKAPIKYAEACAFAPGAGEEEVIDCAGTDENGEYTIEGLPTGSYTVSFSISVPGFESPLNNYLQQYYNGKGFGESPDSVSATAGSTTSGIDAELRPGGQIKGRVTAASNGIPIQGAEACAIEASGEGFQAGCASTNSNGEYAIMGLHTGSYKIEFSDRYFEYEEEFNFEEEVVSEELFTTQFYNDKPSASQGESVAVTAGGAVTGINASMVEPTSVTAKPEDTELPTLSGTPAVGEELLCSRGTWSGSPTSYSYRWFRDGVEINGQTSSFYAVRAADQGHELTCKVTASNSKGSTSALSNSVDVPTEGSPQQESTLTVALAGTGSGAVLSTPSGISCEPNCAHAFTDGTSLVLTAVPSEGSTFAGWSGSCAGTGPCHLTINADTSLTATFTAKSGGGGDEGGGNGVGGGGGVPSGDTSNSGGSPPSTAKPKPAALKCKKGFKKQKLHGKERCLKIKKHRHHH